MQLEFIKVREGLKLAIYMQDDEVASLQTDGWAQAERRESLEVESELLLFADLYEIVEVTVQAGWTRTGSY